MLCPSLKQTVKKNSKKNTHDLMLAMKYGREEKDFVILFHYALSIWVTKNDPSREYTLHLEGGMLPDLG